MKRFDLHFLGRFGNCMFQYAFARAFCARYDYELCTDPWPGEQVFQISHPRCAIAEPLHHEHTAFEELAQVEHISFRSYCQQQKCIDLYTRTLAREWFAWRPEIVERMDQLAGDFPFIAHMRRGDYGGYGYVVVSDESYHECARRIGLPELYEMSEENHDHRLQPFGGELAFVADFFRMTRAATLLRSNSTFAWWAATLAPDSQRVFAPIIDGIEGGTVHRGCLFVEGNWPRFANLDFTTDLHLQP